MLPLVAVLCRRPRLFGRGSTAISSAKRSSRYDWLTRAGKLGLLWASVAAAGFAQEEDFATLSIEELSNIQISSLGRKRAAVFSTPGAASIITGEDINRAGATDLATAIRLAPGLQVARIASAQYAVTARGFNDVTSSKLLVLLDGRSVYSQLSGGVDWSFQTIFLEDVARIEVLRGPAASLWGANAVNGVINVVSKSAHETLGTFVSVARGDQLEGDVAIRQGVRLSSTSALRVYGSYQESDNYGADRKAGARGWDSQLVGARFDWERRAGGGLTLIGEYRGVTQDGNAILPSVLPPYFVVFPEIIRAHGTNLLSRWVHPLGTESELRIQASFEHQGTRAFANAQDRSTGDLDIQVTAHPFPRHDLLGGLTYRTTSDEITSSDWFIFEQASATTQFYGAFIQDEISIIQQRLSLTLGTKFEQNTYTGWEPQPSARLLWHPTPNHAIWAGISRAARIPTRTERGVQLYADSNPPSLLSPLPTRFNAIGSSEFSSEHLTAFEVGHRFKVGSRFSLDTALFYNRYTDLRGLRPEGFTVKFDRVPYVDYNLTLINNLHGETHGGEIALHWEPTSSWKLDASVASVRTGLKENRPGAAPDPSLVGLEGSTPAQEYKLRSSYTSRRGWSLDVIVRHSGRLPAPNVPSYTGLDVRLAWALNSRWTFELVGKDLLDAQHPEAGSFFLDIDIQEISRSGFARISLRY